MTTLRQEAPEYSQYLQFEFDVLIAHTFTFLLPESSLRSYRALSFIPTFWQLEA